MKLNETHQFLAYIDDVNLLGDNINTIKKNTIKKTLLDGSIQVALEVKAEYCIISGVGQNHAIKAEERSFENVAHFKCLGNTVPYRNLIQEEIKRVLNSGTACGHTVQNLLFLVCCLVKIRIYKI
jgi:hypothetical protein